MTMGEQQDGAAIVPVCLNVKELLRVVFLASRAPNPDLPMLAGEGARCSTLFLLWFCVADPVLMFSLSA